MVRPRVEVRPTTEWDIDGLANEVSEDQRKLLESIRGWDPHIWREQMSTCVVRDEPVAIAGVLPYVDAESLILFCFVGKKAKRHKLTLTRWAKACMETTIERFRPRRIEVTTRSDTPVNGHWAEVLGFTHEGTMRKWGVDGADYERWAWVRP